MGAILEPNTHERVGVQLTVCAVESVTGERCLTACASFTSGVILSARHMFAIVHCISSLTCCSTKVSLEAGASQQVKPYLEKHYIGHYPIPKHTDNFVIVFWGWGLGNALKTVGP